MNRFITLSSALLLLSACYTQSPAPTVNRSLQILEKPTAQAQAGPGYYTVKPKDTLYRIALEHGQDYRDIAAWNNLANVDLINEGQVLRVLPPDAGATPSKTTATTAPVVSAGRVEEQALDGTKAKAELVSTPVGKIKREPLVKKEVYSDEAYARLSGTLVATPALPATKSAESPAEKAPETPVANEGGLIWVWPSSNKISASFSESGVKGLDFSGKAGDTVVAAAAGRVVYAGNALRGYGELVIIKHNASLVSVYAHNRKILVKETQEVGKGEKIAEMGNSDSDTVKLHFEIRRQGKPVDPAPFLPKR